jgi:hypothetical protein
MKPWGVLALALVAATAAADAAAIRGVFVGIDKYRYSRTTVPDANFKDLHGAVGDVGRIKAALRAAYGLDLDVERPPSCKTANSLSTTLTDDCADRQSILAALDRTIKASASGDTLLFYFAGHGSQFIDDQVFDQASGSDDTILPTDARKPGAATSADIVDRELDAVINRATAAGVNVVTIFDSCHSGTGTRDIASGGESRSAPSLHVKGVRAAGARGASTTGSGYRVHLAAAADEEEAQETGGDGPRAGVFTTALASALKEMPQASFADIVAEVRLKVEESGHPLQHPQAEGRLQATLGGPDVHVTLLDAVSAGDAVTLLGGQLAAVTEGSTYSVFASTTDAQRGGAEALASGRVTSVDATRATLSLDQAPTHPLPARLVAREKAHAFGRQLLLIRNRARSPEGRALVAQAVAALPFAQIGEPAQLSVESTSAGDAELVLDADDGSRVAGLGDPRDGAFPGKTRTALQKVARVQALMALRTYPVARDVVFCIASGSYDVYTCKEAAMSDTAVLRLGQPAQATVFNRTDQPRFVYVFAIEDDASVTMIIPPYNGIDPPLGPNMPLMRRLSPDSAGRYRFLTISTAVRIDAAALEQEGAGSRDLGRCVTALERALCAAATGKRDASTPKVGEWTAAISTAIVR